MEQNSHRPSETVFSGIAAQQCISPEALLRAFLCFPAFVIADFE